VSIFDEIRDQEFAERSCATSDKDSHGNLKTGPRLTEAVRECAQ
jgi:hypothetical protein